MEFDFAPLIESIVGRSTVGFVDLGERSVSSMGSGTLVTFGSIGGILTCAHVLERVIKRKEIGVVVFPARQAAFQALRVDLSKTSLVTLREPPWSEAGPDLGFLHLPPILMSSLSSIASVINVEKQRANAMAGEPDPEHRVELVSGVISEWTGEAIKTESTVTTTLNALLNIGRVVSKDNAHGFDLFHFEPVPEKDFVLPKSYQGTSGGGLWRLYMRKQDDGSFSLSQSRLVGVAFYERPDDNRIICHGQDSLYRRLFEKIRTTYSTT